MRAPVLMLAAVTLAALLSTPAGASASPANGSYYLQSVVTGLNASDSSGTVAQHRPKGNEDHQQWTLRTSGAAQVLENADEPGKCLGRSGGNAVVAGCAGTDAAWIIETVAADQYTLKDPGSDRYLTLANKPSGANYPDALLSGSNGDLARWYLTPVSVPMAPVPDQRRLDQVTFLTAHNAFANGVDGGFAPPFVNWVPNQTRGINQQLADGVRGFMLDIYQTPDGAILCHTSCTLVSKPVALGVDLQRIVDFLNANPSEIVTVFLEDYVSPTVLRDSLTNVNGLANVLYRPDQAGARDHGWPTVSTLQATNDRLLIFTDHSRSADESAGLTRDSFGVMYQREWTVENYWSMGSGTGTSDWSCYSRWYGANDNIPLTQTNPNFQPLFVMNHFRDTPVGNTPGTDNTKLRDRAERFCEPAARKKPTYLAVDRYDLGNPGSAVAGLNTYVYP
jgi:hypothetical protein